MSDKTSGSMTPNQAQLALQAALNSPLPRFYANTFMNASTPSDILTVFQCNGQNVCIFNFSYVVAKTLSQAIDGLVKDYEARHNITIPTIEMGTAKGPETQVTE